MDQPKKMQKRKVSKELVPLIYPLLKIAATQSNGRRLKNHFKLYMADMSWYT